MAWAKRSPRAASASSAGVAARGVPIAAELVGSQRVDADEEDGSWSAAGRAPAPIPTARPSTATTRATPMLVAATSLRMTCVSYQRAWRGPGRRMWPDAGPGSASGCSRRVFQFSVQAMTPSRRAGKCARAHHGLGSFVPPHRCHFVLSVTADVRIVVSRPSVPTNRPALHDEAAYVRSFDLEAHTALVSEFRRFALLAASAYPVAHHRLRTDWPGPSHRYRDRRNRARCCLA